MIDSARLTRQVETVAAVDLGSNSFHMVVGRFVDGQLRLIDRLRERVALAAGLDHESNLTEEAQERALACLQRFGQRLSDMDDGSVRAVGTNTLRQGRNAREFIARAEEILGHRIEVISGREEARLVYQGVAHSLQQDGGGRRLVIDIGGGSTECIIGERLEPLQVDSLYMGCVSYSQRFFADGELTALAMKRAELSAALELRSTKHFYRALGWSSVAGSSGTIRSIEEVVRANGWSDDGITAKSLEKLRKAVLAAARVDALDLPGLSKDRAPVLPGGLAILRSLFRSLGIERMHAATGALREGLLYDLVGRLAQEDARHRTIRDLERRYQVDVEHAARVERTAVSILKRVADRWKVDLEVGEQFLAWAARIHEIGLVIAFAGYHKHGAYIVRNADLPGFSRNDQELLATLVGIHRRKIAPDAFDALAERPGRLAARLAVVLRLAVRLNRSRSEKQIPDVRAKAKGDGLVLRIPSPWFDEHPLTETDLQTEAGYLKAIGIRLDVEKT